jgi:hypothetical protein
VTDREVAVLQQKCKFKDAELLAAWHKAKTMLEYIHTEKGTVCWQIKILRLILLGF